MQFTCFTSSTKVRLLTPEELQSYLSQLLDAITSKKLILKAAGLDSFAMYLAGDWRMLTYADVC
jgi:hypothetical protein